LILNKFRECVCGLHLSGLVYRPVAGYCRYNIESSDSIKYRICLQYLRNCQLLKNNFVEVFTY